MTLDHNGLIPRDHRHVSRSHKCCGVSLWLAIRDGEVLLEVPKFVCSGTFQQYIRNYSINYVTLEEQKISKANIWVWFAPNGGYSVYYPSNILQRAGILRSHNAFRPNRAWSKMLHGLLFRLFTMAMVVRKPKKKESLRNILEYSGKNKWQMLFTRRIQ